MHIVDFHNLATCGVFFIKKGGLHAHLLNERFRNEWRCRVRPEGLSLPRAPSQCRLLFETYIVVQDFHVPRTAAFLGGS